MDIFFIPFTLAQTFKGENKFNWAYKKLDSLTPKGLVFEREKMLEMKGYQDKE